MNETKVSVGTLKLILSSMLIETGKSIEELAEITGFSCKEIRGHIEKTSFPSLLKFFYIANALGIDGRKILDSKTYLDRLQ